MIHWAWLLLLIPAILLSIYGGIFLGIKICDDDASITYLGCKNMTKGDELNQLEAAAIAEYMKIMGDMSNLDAVIGLKRLFEESIPSYEMAEVYKKADQSSG